MGSRLKSHRLHECPPHSGKPLRFARPSHRTDRRKGAEILEFTLVLLPLLVMLFAFLDMAWAVWAKSTLQRAVRVGVRTGVTITGADAPQGTCLTDIVRNNVQASSMGLLKNSRNLIKINFLQPPTPGSNGAAVDVSNQADGNSPGNIMQVSVQNFSLVPLLPRIFSWKEAPDKNPLVVNVYSADLIEPSRDPPCKGSAP